ncbi:DnaB-like helicase C-terminal domain-containing protein [Bacillus sp. 3255]|uniref:replicative DNA helicase n=1 Tax=Bacillus sp. 3255 TaxID=2817904 RepID=UPI00285483F3|nr:DnaB-like helicase C-terminal domain-containing protein [Bacillus sp. 3255]MDR6884884.1 replicative DNA helicase [Bacillus sp. 3255]
MMMDLQTLNDLQAEQSVLGAILLDSRCLEEISFLEERDFSQRHELIYKVMKYLHERDLPIDLITVVGEFDKFGRIVEIGGVGYLSDMMSAVPSTANVKYYASIVRTKALKRRMYEAGEEMMQAALNGEFETDDEIHAAAEEIADKVRPKSVARMRSFGESKKDYYEHLKTRAQKILSGFKQFDEWSQLWRGWLYIIAGRPSVGKTAKALQLVYGIAQQSRLENGKWIAAKDAGCVMIYSQEMGENEVKDRIVSNVAGVNYNRLINKGGEEGFTDREHEKINEAYDLLETLPIYIQDSSGITIEEIRSTAKQMLKRHGKIAAIIVDYLQIMEITLRRGEKRHEAIGRVTRTAKNMARKMNFVFIMLSQLDRAVDDEEPKLKHLKESGSIEQDADVVEFLWHNGEYDGNVKIVQSIFAKGRNVGLNRFRYRFEWWLQRYVELEKDKEPQKKKAAGKR